MYKTNRHGPRYGFFLPFYKTKEGQILVLATPTDQVRDGLALSHLIRHFPLPEYGGIRQEPGRPGIQLAENLILVGWTELFVNAAEHAVKGRFPWCGEELTDRLGRIDEQCCFRFQGKDERHVVNTVTGQVYKPKQEATHVLDYGVVRRLFRGPLENTIILEGVHRPGTLGAVKAAMSTICLEAIWDALRRLPRFDETLPLEILVESTVKDPSALGVHGLDAVKAVPLLAVYDKQWVFDLSEGGIWRDQLPWDVQLQATGDGRTERLKSANRAGVLPRLEIEADLRGADDGLKKLCRNLLGATGNGNGSRDESALDHLLEQLTLASPEFQVFLVDKKPFRIHERRQELPIGNTPIRAVRKQFLIHLALGRFLDRRFRCTTESVQRLFPNFEHAVSAEEVAGCFIGRVPGRLREGFEPLLGPAKSPKGYVQVDCVRPKRIYRLRLERSALVLKLRL